MTGYLEGLRNAELNTVKSWFKPNTDVLEIGGGSGYQASVIASWGCNVTSIDLPNRPIKGVSYYAVQDYNGYNVPFENDSFDIIFSSNVLEHIQHLPQILSEIHRTLKPNGLAVHILPNTSWRFWTSLSHYGYLLKYILRQEKSKLGSADALSINQTLRRNGIFCTMRRALFSGPHGEYPNALVELYFFSKTRWLKVFDKNNFKVEQVIENKIFYTGYSLFPIVSLEIRRTMSQYLGSACSAYIMRSK